MAQRSIWVSRTSIYTVLIAVFILILSGCTASNSVVSDTTGSGDTTTTDPGGTTLTTTYNPGNGSGTASMSGTSSSGTNKNPVITLKSSASSLAFGGEVVLTAEALDPDGDQLTLSWVASSGTFFGQTSNKTTWKAPTAQGSYEISCSADDKKGGKGLAKVTLSVLGGRTYILKVSMARYCLEANDLQGDVATDWVAIPNAKVTFVNLAKELVSDSAGRVSFDLDAGGKIASDTEVIIKYRDWEAHYNATFLTTGASQVDEVQFYPGYEGVTVAVAKGDSFSVKRGGVEVNTVQSSNGETRPLNEVGVSIGSSQQIAKEGIAFMSVGDTTSDDTFLNLTKSGFSSLESLKIPVSFDGLTLIHAQMNPTGSTYKSESTISYTKPFNGQKNVSIRGPFEIGFSQPMEKGTLFDDFEMIMQDSSGKTSVSVRGYDIRNRFQLEWMSPTILRMTPLSVLKQLQKYSFHVTRWNGRSVDGRLLKNFASTFGTFTTDVDQAPQITSMVPKNGDTNISRAGPFDLMFDQPMDPNSLTDNLLMEISDVKNGLKVTIDGAAMASVFSITWLQNDTYVSLVPRKILKARNAYQVRLIRTNLKSKTGKVVSNISGLWGQFTTGDL